MKWSKKALLAKIETTYGVDASPTGAANAVLIPGDDVELTPLNASYEPRPIVRAGGQYGSYTEDLVGTHVALAFSVEMAGGGTADTPAVYGPLLRACGLAQAITASTKVEYTPISAAFESVSIYLHLDGHLHKILGCRGTATWEWAKNKYPRIKFNLLGLFVAVADASFPTPTYTAAQKPLLVSDVNTPTLTLHGTAVKVASLSVPLGVKAEYRELVNSTSIEVVDRQTTGQIVLEAVSVATKDWYGAVTAATLAALQIAHGTVTGNIVQLDAPKVQLKNPKPSGDQDFAMLTLDLVMTPNAGNDEIVFTTK
jgi:hypothetical protein